MKKECSVGFVILNYKIYDDTISCVESIRRVIDTDDYYIVIVENGSGNDSFQVLTQRYNKDEKIHVIDTGANLGFSKGNNVGIRYLKEHYDPHFVVALNSDIIMFQKNFLKLLDDIFAKEQFAVLGPMIVNGKLNVMSNPMRIKRLSVEQAKHEIKYCQKMLKLNKLHLIKLYEFFRSLKKRNLQVKQRLYIEQKQDITLHGCFYVFSKLFFQEYSGFDELTFLYLEEDILQYHLEQAKLKSLYSPEIVVYHNEGASTGYKRNTSEKNRFIYCNRIEALQTYLELIT